MRRMGKILVTALAVAGLGAMGHQAARAAATADGSRTIYISVGEKSLPPFGWVDFCRRYKGECDAGPTTPLDVNWTPEAAKRARKINTWVNTHVTPVSDMDHWGVVDRWDYPTDGMGDCEDFVLMKRRLLIEEGFPRQALLVTVVKDQRGDGHAVLTVKTNKGEFVLDNLEEEVRPWGETPYHYIKRQSQTDQNVWLDIGDPRSAPLIVSR
jgi:predicted transglutaminase-like cysteine proteinase